MRGGEKGWEMEDEDRLQLDKREIAELKRKCGLNIKNSSKY